MEAVWRGADEDGSFGFCAVTNPARVTSRASVETVKRVFNTEHVARDATLRPRPRKSTGCKGGDSGGKNRFQLDITRPLEQSVCSNCPNC